MMPRTAEEHHKYRDELFGVIDRQDQRIKELTAKVDFLEQENNRLLTELIFAQAREDTRK